MRLSDLSRDTVSKGSTANGSLSSAASQAVDCDCYSRVGSRGVVLRSSHLARVLVERSDNTVVRLIGFPGSQLDQPQSNNLLFGDMWKARLSLHTAKLGPK